MMDARPPAASAEPAGHCAKEDAHEPTEEEKDSAVPRPEDLVQKETQEPRCRFILYSYYVHHLPVPGYATTAELNKFMEELEYLDKKWRAWHGRGPSASIIARMLGIDDSISVADYRQECIGSMEDAYLPWRVHYQRQMGLAVEPFVLALYGMLLGDSTLQMAKGVTSVHPEYFFAIATEDIRVMRGDALVRVGEIKCPAETDIYYALPRKYMMQVQWTMWVKRAPECDFMSIKYNKETSDAEYVAIRVPYCEAAIRAALPIVRDFLRDVICAAASSDAVPPIEKHPYHFDLDGIPAVQLVHLNKVAGIVPNGFQLLLQAHQKARDEADNLLAEQARLGIVPRKRRGSLSK